MSETLARRVARLFCVGFPGKAPTPELVELLELGVSGVILFSRNVGEPAELFELIRAIKTLRAAPTLVTVDQEGGSVRRLRSGFTELPPLAALGASADPELARALGALLARELSAVGIDWNLAPVLDVDTNPDNPVIGARSLGRDPALVAQLGVELALAMQAEGVAACGKHFPGHGDTVLDSHRALPRLDHDLARLLEVELVPFAAAARAGVASIMSAHVIFSALDPDYPATLSRGVLTGLLRERLGYEGLVVSDDLEMAAIVDYYGIDEAAVRGLEAGIDLFLVCHTATRAHAAIEAIVRAIEHGRLAVERLEAAERRVASFTQRWAAPPRSEPALESLRTPSHLALAERLFAFSAPDTARDPTGAR